ncbi:MerR family transcriptional regulator, partial [Cupriavidus sp. CP313]
MALTVKCARCCEGRLSGLLRGVAGRFRSPAAGASFPNPAAAPLIKVYRINEFAKRIGRAPSTVRRWEREGILAAKRLPSGHRYFDESDVRATLGGGPEKRSTIVYCRVSSAGQRDDLRSQVA